MSSGFETEMGTASSGRRRRSAGLRVTVGDRCGGVRRQAPSPAGQGAGGRASTTCTATSSHPPAPRVGSPRRTATAVDAGGAAYLATHVEACESQVENSVLLSTGDSIGASPLASALFHDEPTVDGAERASGVAGARASATTSSTRATPSCCACSGAAAIPTDGCASARASPAWTSRCWAPTSTSSAPGCRRCAPFKVVRGRRVRHRRHRRDAGGPADRSSSPSGIEDLTLR